MNALPIRQQGNYRELLTAFAMALAAWSLVALSSGLFHGGFLLWDDIIIADFHSGLKSSGFFELYARVAAQDLNIRFRPLALLHYLTMARLYGLNYTALLWHNIGIVSLACGFLYAAARNIGASVTAAFMFVAVVFIGNQGVIGLRIVLAENPGMLFIAIGAHALTREKRMLAAIFFLLAALTKESFVLLAPALVWADFLLQGRSDLRGYVTAHKPFLAAITTIMLVVLGVIILQVGTHSIGYAGVDKETFSLDKLARAFLAAFLTKGCGLVLIPVAVGLIMIPGNGFSLNKRKLVNGTILCALVLLPQVALYAKSGIFMHYLLPAQLWSGLALLMLWHDPLGIPSRYQQYFRIWAVALLLFNTFLFLRNARDIANWGREARMAMERVTSLTAPQDTILIMGHPIRDYEKASDAGKFMATELYERPHYAILPTTTETRGTELERKITRRFMDANRTFIEKRSSLFHNAPCILFMPGAYAELMKNDTIGTGINGMDTMQVASYIIAKPAHK